MSRLFSTRSQSNADRSMHSPSKFVADVFDRPQKSLHRSHAAKNKESPVFKSMYDLPLMQIISRLKGVRHSFKRVAFIGPNPHLFLLNNPYKELEEFTFIENSQKSVEKSYEMIEALLAQDAM